jgi:glycosyltransferase involved in cell wall biosynthesis
MSSLWFGEPEHLSMKETAAIELSIVMPCLDEARTVGVCVKKALSFLATNGVSGEVVVADNGSTDGSQEIARNLGARVVPVAERGYGSALRAGIAAARGRFVVMGDSDDSYDFLGLRPFLEKLREGYDLVLGNRFAGGIQSGAMPALHRFFGNPLLTAIGRLLYGGPSRDFYCGLRGFRRDAVLALTLDTTGMEFALEMIVKARIAGLRMTEVATTLAPDGRDRPPHLRSWRDGWRSLRFFLLLSPSGLFLYPGLAVFATGLLVSTLLMLGDIHLGRIVFARHTLVVSCAAVNLGFQAIAFWVFAKIVGIESGLLPRDAGFERLRRRLSVEAGSLAGAVLILLGVAGMLGSVLYWSSVAFGPVEWDFLIRLLSVSTAMTVLGFQCIYSVFFIYLLTYLAARRARSSAAQRNDVAPERAGALTGPASHFEHDRQRAI